MAEFPINSVLLLIAILISASLGSIATLICCAVSLRMSRKTSFIHIGRKIYKLKEFV